jgi:hypothetical protein
MLSKLLNYVQFIVSFMNLIAWYSWSVFRTNECICDMFYTCWLWLPVRIYKIEIRNEMK